MFSIGKRNKKGVAASFLLLLAVQNFYPAAAYALTSGPVQPEMQKFQPAGVTNMVDPFSGDFKYDLPIMDVGGYPVNLSYHSGGGMEDEASWVGMGWSLNPGSVNRNMRGIPDDFTGKTSDDSDPADMIRSTQHKKDFYKIGGRFVVKPSLFGWEWGKASLHLGVYKDNYYGIGGELGASLNFSMDVSSTSTLTAGLGLNSDTRGGVSLSPSLTLDSHAAECKELNSGSLTGGFTYNTRSGLQEVNLGASFGGTARLWDENGNETAAAALSIGVGSFNKYFIHTYTPTFGTSTTSTNNSFSFDFGAAIFGVYTGFGGTGYIYTEKNNEETTSLPAFGYLNYAAGAHNTNAILDFNREKDGPFLTNAPAIPIPVSTEDYFTATSQGGVQQFRPYYNGEYTIFDRTYTNNSSSFGLGVSGGAGNAFQVGGRVNANGSGTSAVTRRWENYYTRTADNTMPPALGPSGKMPEQTWFKKTGELTMADNLYYSSFYNDITQKVTISPGLRVGANTLASVDFNGSHHPVSNLRRNDRDIRTASFSYLTAKEAAQYGLDKMINGQYRRVDPKSTPDGTLTVHKPHHISEITVTDEGGKRMVYGIPVYNIDQEEVSFSVAGQPDAGNSFSQTRKTGLVSYNNGSDLDNSVGNNKGRANIFNRKIIPPYATSWLLTGMLSPDYVDRTGDGITDDDLGTAVKFGYQKQDNYYNWRAPYDYKMAGYNEGFLSDKKDDKGSYVFGQKELWYLDRIESKTMVAIFFKSPRADGYGAAGGDGGIGGDDQRVLKLDSIRLFTKAELASHPDQPIPIKVAHFEYDYSLYPGQPNNIGQPVPGRNPLLPYEPYDPNDPYNMTLKNQNNQSASVDLNALHGKLTLRKVYFTFGSSVLARTNPYVFSYDMRPIHAIPGLPGQPDPAEAADSYTQRQSDRWGTYKQSAYNRYVSSPTGNKNFLNNSEFPYTLQPTNSELFDTRLLTDRFASKWQLNSIVTPTGGIISVDYESDDYSYVQDRKAMEECQLMGTGGTDPATGLIRAGKLYVKVPVAPQGRADFISTYLSGPNGQKWNNIAFKVYTDMDNHSHYEYVYGYAEIDYDNSKSDLDNTGDDFDINGDVVGIRVKMLNGYNPVSKAAWQVIQTDLPQYAYETYDNSDASGFGGDVIAAVKSIVQAFVNFRELGQSFDQTASGKGYANRIVPEKSMVRLNCPIGTPVQSAQAARPTYGKLGGGCRVRRVELSDNWNTIGGAGSKTLVNGILYEYTTKDDKGNPISSGVASYEPGIGNEENPFHEPVPYTEKVEWSQDRYHFIERPFGESYFPAPQVGYSEVKATSYGADKPFYETPTTVYTNTGYTLLRFYTAKDFPTQVDYLPLDQQTMENDLTILLFASRYTKRVVTSQGFKVVLNDMHGKPRSTGAYDKGDALISSTEYFYNVKDDKAAQKQLNNTVPVLAPDGSIASTGNLIGTDEDLVTDIRESGSASGGTSIGAYFGAFWAFWPVPYGGLSYNATASVRSYNSVSTIKVIHQYGLLKSIKTTQNGSTLTADNLLWDGMTGQVLLSRHQNEFDDYTYALNYPAYMAYDGMGGAYRNIGALFTNLQLTGGAIPSAYKLYLAPGDELVDVDEGTGIHGWVIPDNNSAGNYRLIDATGNFITTPGNYRLMRSGRRNLLSTSAGTVVTMNNPMVPSGSVYSLQVGVDKRLLNAKAVTYKDEWDMPVPTTYVVTPQMITDACVPSTFSVNHAPSGEYIVKFLQELFLSNVKPSVTRRNLFSFVEDNVTLADLVNQGIAANLFDNTMISSLLGSCSGGPCHYTDLSQIKYYLLNKHPDAANPGKYKLQTGDQAYIGTATQQLGRIDFGPVSTTITTNLETGSSPLFCSETHIACNSESTAYVAVNFSTGNCSTNPSDMKLTWNAFPYQYQSGPPIVACNDPVGQLINPYYQDVKGVWRMEYDHVYQVNRVQTVGNPAQAGGTNIRTSGYYNSFTPFWVLNGHQLTPLQEVTNALPHTLSDPLWQWTSKSLHFDQKGNETENTDPLNRHSAALFGYQQSAITAAATNAGQNEIAFEGFEDYYFSLIPLTSSPDHCPMARHLDLGFPQPTSGLPMQTPDGSTLVTSPVHSGNYALQLHSLNISQPAGNINPVTKFLDFDAVGHYILLANDQAAGFAPFPTHHYLLSCWVKDEEYAIHNTISGLQITINGQTTDFSTWHLPVVDNWKKLEIPFDGASSFTLQMTGSGSIYIDDLRIQPLDAQMRSFVYDDRTMRLTGMLDENNFGIFYEYDEEGTPIRIKKETEKGVKTIKENRQSYRKYIQTSN
jgi:hypothetical protein